MKGMVDFFNRVRGFGFVSGEDQKQYFAHHSDIVGDEKFKILNEGDSIEFEPVEQDRDQFKHDKATGIKVVTNAINDKEVKDESGSN